MEPLPCDFIDELVPLCEPVPLCDVLPLAEGLFALPPVPDCCAIAAPA
jgi:hypothetical protein